MNKRVLVLISVILLCLTVLWLVRTNRSTSKSPEPLSSPPGDPTTVPSRVETVRTDSVVEKTQPSLSPQELLEEMARARGVPLDVLTQEALTRLTNISDEIRATANGAIE